MIHAVDRGRAPSAGRGAGTRLTDARALDPGLVAVPADPAGDAALVAAAGALGGALVAAGRGRRRRTGCGSTSPASRICSAARRGLVRDIAARLRRARPDAPAWRSRRRPAAAWALARFGSAAAICGEDAGANAGAPARRRACACRRRPTRTLERLGLKTIGALGRDAAAERSRGASARPTIRSMRSTGCSGRKPEPLTAAPTEPPPRATLRLAEPVDASGGGGPGARAAGARPGAASWSSGGSARGGWR